MTPINSSLPKPEGDDQALYDFEDKLLKQVAETRLDRPETPDTPQALQPATFEQALADGTIPTFPDQPDDKIPDVDPPPLDADAEVAAYREFLALVNQYKDAGTVVTAIDPDDFLKGLI